MSRATATFEGHGVTIDIVIEVPDEHSAETLPNALALTLHSAIKTTVK